MLKGKIISKSDRERWAPRRGAFEAEFLRFLDNEKSVSGEAAAIWRGLPRRSAFELEIGRFFELNPENRFNQLAGATANRFNQVGN